MPEGESVSITAVPEARTLNVVFTGMPCASLPSQSPASDCNFLKAAVECAPAQSGAAMKVASSRCSESLRCDMDASWKTAGAGRGLHRTMVGRDMRALTLELREGKQRCKEGFAGAKPLEALEAPLHRPRL